MLHCEKMQDHKSNVLNRLQPNKTLVCLKLYEVGYLDCVIFQFRSITVISPCLRIPWFTVSCQNNDGTVLLTSPASSSGLRRTLDPHL